MTAAGWVGSSPLNEQLIFIVGAQRSGTNWLQRIVATHPDVVGLTTETGLFSLGIKPLTERFHHGAIGSYRLATMYIDRSELLAALRRFCDTVFASAREGLEPGAGRILERTPDHVFELGLMSEVYPDARFIHIVRDGRDVVRSLVSQSWGPDSIAEAAGRWKAAVDAARSAAIDADHLYEIRYEELLRDTRTQSARLFEWLGLDHPDALLDRVEAEARFHYNVDPSDLRVGAGKWQSHFSASDIEVFDRVAGRTLREMGYATAAPALGVEPPTAAPATGRSRSAPGRIVRRIKAAMRTNGRTASGAERLERAHQAQQIFDTFLERVGTGRLDELDDILHALPRITIVDKGTRWEGTGGTAVDRLREALAKDDAFGGKQVFGDTWPGSPAVALLSYEIDGVGRDRVFVVYVEGQAITRISYYVFPIDRRPERASSS